jgi:hypothetical protein
VKVTPSIRKRVLARDEFCVRCGFLIDPGNYSIHHRKPRGMGGTKDPAISRLSNLLALCGSGTTGCHGWVESSRRLAYERGFLLHHNDNAKTTPVFTYAGWRLFDNDGNVLEVAA